MASSEPVKRQNSAWTRDADLERGEGRMSKSVYRWTTMVLGFQCLGVIYGDVGTSPLYVFASVFTEGPPSPRDVVGVTSLIIWSITALVLLKYCTIVLRADDHGQGGTFALYSQLRRQGTRAAREAIEGGGDGSRRDADWRQRLIQGRAMQNVLRVLVVLGVGAIMGDGVLTPAISVISACEGLELATSSITRTSIVGIACGILVALFMLQRFGTSKVGFLFSPVSLTWFTCNFCIGVYNIIKYEPSVLKAISPHYAFVYLGRNGKVGWEALSGVLLCFTGTEALFADLGHFNRQAVQLGLLAVVYPSLMITYLGQASYLTVHPEKVSTTFYSALPSWTFWPMFVVATATAIVASQALISASFQIVKQAIAQGFFPRFRIKHTNAKHEGQIYVPVINWTLMILTVVVVATFKSSAKIGQAYGIAVIADMLLTTHFLTLLMVVVWRKNMVFPAMFYIIFGSIEAVFVSSALRKVPSGGWFSLMMAAIYAYIMLLWYYGSSRKNRFFTATRRNLADLLRIRTPKADTIAKKADQALARGRGQLQLTATRVVVKRTPGIGIYYDDSIYGAPHTLAELVTRLPVIQECVIFLTIRAVPIPTVMQQERFLVEEQGLPGFFHVVARFGYNETVVQDAAFVQGMLQTIMSLLCRTLRLTMVESQILKEEIEGLPETVRAEVDGAGGALHGTVHNSILTADGSDPMSVAMTGIDTEMRRRKTKRPTILQQDGTISWPVLGSTEDATAAGSAVARAVPLTFPQEMARFSEKVARAIARQGTESPLVGRAQLLASELAVVAAAGQAAEVTYIMGRTHLNVGPVTHRNFVKKYALELPFESFLNNTGTSAHQAYHVPSDRLLQVGLRYTI